MFSLIYGFLEYLLRKEELHILILGLDKAGKTTLLENLKTLYTDFPGLRPDQIRPTVGLNIGRMDAYKASLIFWDLGGQTGLRSIWDKYYSETHAVIFVIDACDPERFEEAKVALDDVVQNADLAGAPLLIVGNKQDEEEATKVEEIAAQLGLQKMTGRVAQVHNISALTGEGVRDSILWLVNQIKQAPRTNTLRSRVGL